MRYAGLSDKLSSFGLYELNPAFDEHGQTAHLAAQMIWYLTEGYYNRKKDVPLKSKTDFVKYRVALKRADRRSSFTRARRANAGGWKCRTQQQGALSSSPPCPRSYHDYEIALRDEMPERWWQAFQKLS